MNYTKSSYMSYEELRISKLLSSLVSNKMLTGVRYCANASVYNPVLAVTELTTAQSIILALFYGLMSSDLKLCHFLQGLISKVDQLKSSYLSLWLRDDYKFNTSDVYKVLSNLAHLIRGQHINLPDYVLRIFVGLNSKYSIIDICKANKDLEAFYFLLSVNVPCSRSQQTDKISVGGPKSFQWSSSSTISNQSTMQSFSNPFGTSTDSRKPEIKLRKSVMKEPINYSDGHREPKSFQRSRSSSISNQSHCSEFSIYTDTLKQEVELRKSLNTRTRGPQPKEKKSLANAISTPNITELVINLLKEPNNHSNRGGPKSFQWSSSSTISNQSTMQSFSNPFGTSTDSRKPEIKLRKSVMKEPINYSDGHREPKSFQRSRSSSISNQSHCSEFSIYTDTLKQEVELRKSLNTRTRGPQPKEKKSLANAISTPNITELVINLIKEPNNHSDKGPKSFQRSSSSAISNQSTMRSFSNPFGTSTDSRKPEVKPRNSLMKEPINDSDRHREPKSFQRSRSSSISNQSQRSELSICTDTLKQEVELRNSCLLKEPNNHSDEGPKSFQRSSSSTISNQSTMQSFSNPFGTSTDSRKPEIKPRKSLMKELINDSDGHGERKSFQRSRSSSISNQSQYSELSICTDTLKQEVELRNSCNVEMSAEAELVLSYLSKIGSTSVSPSHISHVVCKRDRRGGKSPLHLASRDGLLAVVKGLIKYGAPVNCRDDVGFTPAHYAAREGNIEILEVLKKHKADLTAVGDSGDTLLHLAARKNHAGTCGWLLDNLVLIDTQGYKGRTALHCAAMWGYLETVRLLLMRKASVHIKDYYHNTAYDLACSQGHSKVSNILRNVM